MCALTHINYEQELNRLPNTTKFNNLLRYKFNPTSNKLNNQKETTNNQPTNNDQLCLPTNQSKETSNNERTNFQLGTNP